MGCGSRISVDGVESGKKENARAGGAGGGRARLLAGPCLLRRAGAGARVGSARVRVWKCALS
jgi:hypothetical protein